MLRRNKIFTIASEPSQKESILGKGYDSLLHNKKRAMTLESDSNADLVTKTKQLLGTAKKDEHGR